MGKWLWRIADDSNGLWKQVIYPKYDISRDVWLVCDPLPRFSALWKEILASNEGFFWQVGYHVGKGGKIYFWTDLWVGEVPLASLFPDLFCCASNQEAQVLDYMERRGDMIAWRPIFKRNLNKIEEDQFRSLLTVIGSVFIPRDWHNIRIWMASGDGIFSVASFRSMTRNAELNHHYWARLWSMKAPPRVITFGWNAILGGILTMDNLRHRRVNHINACPMCLQRRKPLITYC